MTLATCILAVLSFPVDSVHILPEVEVSAQVKQHEEYTRQGISASSLSLQTIEEKRIDEPKNLSALIPNFFQPDYGAKITSSIYVRGMGARIDQPAMGLYIDNVPALNKNSYDIDFFDIRSIDVLRGPQGTLYGRNTSGGVINIYTLSPMNYRGTRIQTDYGNANALKINLSTYQHATNNLAYSIALNHRQSDGFYTNDYDGEKCDRIQSNGARIRLQWASNRRWSFNNVLYINHIEQDGFSYSRYDETLQQAQGINHNDPCTYRRFYLSNGMTWLYRGASWQFVSTTAFQYMDDKMTLDQDFLPVSLFTLTQAQRENAVTQEFVMKSTGNRNWQWLLGAFGFYKHISMNAPVIFKRDGINELILENANRGIQTVLPNAKLQFQEDEFPIISQFQLPTSGASLFHQSTFQSGSKWKFTAGIRLDYEHAAIRYHNEATLHYRLAFATQTPPFNMLTSTLDGRNNMHFIEILPQASAIYQWKTGNIYFTTARGYKTGGFNTQIFSDVLQNKLMDDLMSDMGVRFDSSAAYDTQSAISYQPEYSWNYELGCHLKSANKKWNMDAALFYIDCTNQQLTVFPPGKSTGRLMSNAGHTRSIGAELSLQYQESGWQLIGNYGFTDARFITYNDGNTDYARNFIPYAPQHTVYLSSSYCFSFNNRWIDQLTLQADWQGIGKIYWNESNTFSQPFYGQLGGVVSYEKKRMNISLWTKNLTGTEFNTFYFKSVGNSFVQQGKPLQAGISLKIIIN